MMEENNNSMLPKAYTNKSEASTVHEIETITTSKFLQEFNKPDCLFTDNPDNLTSCAFSSSQENLLLLSNKKKQPLSKEQASLKLFLKTALERKEIANSNFRMCKYQESAHEYYKAINLLLSINKDTKKLLEINNYYNMLIECYNNLAMCKLKLKEFNDVISITNKVFEISKLNLKASCYRAKALFHIGSYKECLVYAKSAISQQPNQAMMQLIQDSEDKLDEEYQSIFNKNKLKSTIDELNNGKILKDNLQQSFNQKNSNNTNKQSQSTIIKLIKILFLSLYESIKKNKLLCVLVSLIIFIIAKKKSKILNAFYSTLYS